MLDVCVEVLRFAQDVKSDCSASALNDRVGLDLHQHLWRDQFTHLHHARRRPNVLEEFAVSAPDLLPLRDIDHVDARADDVLHCGSGPLQRGLDVSKRLERLHVGIAGAHNLSIGTRGCRAGYADVIANTHGPGIAHDGLPGCSAGDVLSRHGDSSMNTRIS